MKKLLLFVLALTTLIFFAMQTSACYDCYYPTYGYSYPSTYSTAYSYNRPFGHSYYYQPFADTSYGSRYGFNSRDYSSFNYNSVQLPHGSYIIDYNYNSQRVNGNYYRAKIYDNDGYPVQYTYSRSLEVSERRRY